MKKIIIILLVFVSAISLAQEKIQSAEEYQKEMNVRFSDSLTSPLMKEDLVNFKGLDFFPIDKKYSVQATFKRVKGKAFEMKTTTDRKPQYRVYGVLKFQIEGKELQLFVYQNLELITRPGFKDYLFLPFSDMTNGSETYIGGRYLDMRIPKEKMVIIDFNKAYNPYCAYNYKYSCPVVPLENDLKVEIKAGVKKFHD
ncbi:DUF1684 domain-containing protein [Flavobacterium luminosum]|uniref:DUF1684 domain-containing protein n=1 Tax=Flavobacterium luminosum TaxID=2949086 RepID=A0ABT0TM79_9FLAO|nr:DUF1684 domain-containing protein [Flavobacterium sp. HXWNR70]MCL9808599.1 DUF1684 domain-containing protein [Flavobacterium sp. HXWNR70]